VPADLKPPGWSQVSDFTHQGDEYMKWQHKGAWVLLFALMIGCGSTASLVDFNKSALRASYRSFDFMPQPAPSAMGPIAESPANRTVIMSSIERNLKRRGLAKKSLEPDLLVAYYAGFRGKVDVSFWGYKYSPDDEYQNGTVHAEAYEDGTIIIDLVDAKSSELIWRGWSKGIISSPGKAENSIRMTINKVMENYPPK
jgi:hypothetical protein